MEERKVLEAKKKYDEGHGQLMKGDYRRARQAFDEAISINPTDARAHAGQANALFGMQEIEKALKFFFKLPTFSQLFNFFII